MGSFHFYIAKSVFNKILDDPYNEELWKNLQGYLSVNFSKLRILDELYFKSIDAKGDDEKITSLRLLLAKYDAEKQEYLSKDEFEKVNILHRLITTIQSRIDYLIYKNALEYTSGSYLYNFKDDYLGFAKTESEYINARVEKLLFDLNELRQDSN